MQNFPVLSLLIRSVAFCGIAQLCKSMQTSIFNDIVDYHSPAKNRFFGIFFFGISKMLMIFFCCGFAVAAQFFGHVMNSSYVYHDSALTFDFQ